MEKRGTCGRESWGDNNILSDVNVFLCTDAAYKTKKIVFLDLDSKPRSEMIAICKNTE